MHKSLKILLFQAKKTRLMYKYLENAKLSGLGILGNGLDALLRDFITIEVI
jgi:hypothetical protein